MDVKYKAFYQNSLYLKFLRNVHFLENQLDLLGPVLKISFDSLLRVLVICLNMRINKEWPSKLAMADKIFEPNKDY